MEVFTDHFLTVNPELITVIDELMEEENMSRHGTVKTQPNGLEVDPESDEVLIAARFRRDDPEYLLHIWAGTQTFYVEYHAGFDGGIPVEASYHEITRTDVQAALDTLLPDPVYGARFDATRLRALGFRVTRDAGGE